MPKANKTAKTHKGLAKRLRKTRTGKILRHKAGRSHLMSHKSGKRRRRLRRKDTVEGATARRFAPLLREA